jgi:hypothetical protein
MKMNIWTYSPDYFSPTKNCSNFLLADYRSPLTFAASKETGSQKTEVRSKELKFSSFPGSDFRPHTSKSLYGKSW